MAMAIYKYDQMIPWFKLRGYIENRLKESDHRLRQAVAIEEVYHTQGQSLLLEELLSLPNTLTMIDDSQISSTYNRSGGMFTKEELAKLQEVKYGKEKESKDS